MQKKGLGICAFMCPFKPGLSDCILRGLTKVTH
jgi:hypothetical protein